MSGGLRREPSLLWRLTSASFAKRFDCDSDGGENECSGNGTKGDGSGVRGEAWGGSLCCELVVAGCRQVMGGRSGEVLVVELVVADGLTAEGGVEDLTLVLLFKVSA